MWSYKTIHFGIQRKIVSNMTTDSWRHVPHVTYTYEPDVTDLLTELDKMNATSGMQRITLNTLIMKAITVGVKEAPFLNAYIEFNRHFVKGHIDLIDYVNVSMPMTMPTGEMMTVNIRDCDKKSLDEIADSIKEVRRKFEKTNLDQAMYEVSIENTMKDFKKGKIDQTVFRLVGSLLGKHKVKTLKGKAKKDYEKIPPHDRLTARDIRQGTITISNIGSLYPGQKGLVTLLEIIPPQVACFGVSSVVDRPEVVVHEDGSKTIEIRKVMPICIAFDHRALDFGDLVPFLKKMDDIFAHPEIVETWRKKK